MGRTADEMLGDAGEFLTCLRAALLPHLCAEDVSVTAKVPFNVLMCREVLARRFLELTNAGLAALQRKEFASTAVLARSAVETGAALWYLGRSVRSAVARGRSAEVQKRVVRLLHGSRTTPNAPPAVNVVTFLEELEKTIPGASAAYDGLSELAHPNWAGTLYLFGRPDREARACVFGPSADEAELTVRNAAILNGTCLLVEAALESIATDIGGLVTICERELGAA